MSYTGDDVAGVGGWLSFLVIMLAVLTPLGLVAGTASDLYGDPAIATFFGPVWGQLQAISWASVLLGVAVCWFLVYRLNRVENWATVRLTIAGLWFLAAGLSVVQIGAISYYSGVPVVTLLGEAPLEIVRPLVVATAWTLYLLMSRRVANTYRPRPIAEEMAERFA
jgi:hypothetical protein